MDAHDPDPPKLYPLKRSEAELRRLSLQDELIGESTLALFERAGITKGMRVLDVGSGAGDVAFAVAGLVGPAGSVVGVELDTPSAETARRRAEDAGIGNVEFLSGDVATLELPGPFDAAVGRFVLMHLPDPTGVLSRVRESLRAGGPAAFQEAHLALPWISFPSSPTLEQVQAVRARALASNRLAYSHMGLALRGTYLKAGFPDPDIRADAQIGGGPGWPGYRYLEETARGLLGMWKRVGAEGADDIELEGMAERIEREVGAEGSVLIHTMVGAWAPAP